MKMTDSMMCIPSIRACRNGYGHSLNREMGKIGVDIMYDFMTRLPQAEKEVYKCLAGIYGKTAKEIESQELDETIEQIKKVGQSKTVMGLLKLAIR